MEPLKVNRVIDDSDIPDTIFDDIEIEKYFLKTNVESLYIMTAGMLNKTYASRVADFDWNVLFAYSFKSAFRRGN